MWYPASVLHTGLWQNTLATRRTVQPSSKKIHTEGSELAIPKSNTPATGRCGDLLIQASFPQTVIGSNYITGGYQEGRQITQLNQDLNVVSRWRIAHRSLAEYTGTQGDSKLMI